MSKAARAAKRRRVGPPAAVAAGALALACAPPAGQAEEEFAGFRVTGVEGRAVVRFIEDDLATSAGGATSKQRQTDLRAELFLLTHSFVYHPNFLQLDVGFGPIYQQARFSADFADTRSRRGLYDLSARGTFLRDKPYTGSVFYEHLNPYVSVGPAQVLLQETDRYGVDLSLLSPFTPVPLRLDASRQRALGSGSGLTVDDRIDQLGLIADGSIGGLGASQLRLRTLRAESQSGSVLLPIQRTRSDTRSAALDTRLQFGARRQYRLLNLLSFDSQRYEFSGSGLPPDRETGRALLDLHSQHSETLQSFANYSFHHDDQGTQRSDTNRGGLGFSYAPTAALTTTLDGSLERVRSTPFTLTTRGAGASARYRHDLGAGSAEAGYFVRFDSRDQRATELAVAVVGERLVLTGVDLVPLSRPRVEPASIVVQNETRTQTYVEGLDYAVSVLGTLTRIQRLATGNITDGQPVLVDYSYAVGGTFAYTQLDQGVNLGWSWRRYVNVYARWFESRPRLQSGEPLLTLNTVRSTIVGLRADVPLGGLLVAGGSAEREDRRETILPFKRNSGDAYLQIEEALFGPGGLRLGFRRSRVDYESSSLDVDLTGYELHYWVRMPGDVELLADASVETDTGAPIERRRDFGAVRVRWRFRKLSLTLNATHTRETQGTAQTRRTLGQLQLQRDF